MCKCNRKSSNDFWNLVKSLTLKKGWNKILNKEKNDSGLEESSKENGEYTTKTIKEIGRILSYEENEIDEWLNNDVPDPGYQILNDDEIVDEIQGENEENKNECFENDPGPARSLCMFGNSYEMVWTAERRRSYSSNMSKKNLRYGSIEKNVFFEASNSQKLFCLNCNI